MGKDWSICCHGSIWTTDVLFALANLEEERLTRLHPRPTDKVSKKDSLGYPAFRALGETIHAVLEREVDLRDECGNQRKRLVRQNRTFSNLCETYDALKGRRKGYFLECRAQWRKLWRMQGDKIQERQEEEKSLRALCVIYATSCPGPNFEPSNKLIHKNVRRVRNGANFDDTVLKELKEVLMYRLGMIDLANEYKRILALEFEDCDLFDVQEWEKETSGRDRARLYAGVGDWGRFDFYGSCWEKICKAGIFPRRPLGQRYGFSKPLAYLAAALTDSGMSSEECDEAIRKCIKVKELIVENLTGMVRADKKVRKATNVTSYTLRDKRTGNRSHGE